jgi:hypothetical protein
MSSLPVGRAYQPWALTHVRARIGLGLGALVPVLAPAALLAAVLAGIGTQIIVPDTWVALVSGREIAEHGLPRVEHLTVIASGHSWVDQQWLAQLALYELQHVGGVGLMVATCIIAVVAAFAFAARVAHERGAAPVAILGFFVFAFIAGPWGLQVRTQALALPLFSLVLWLLLRDPNALRRSTLWVLPILCLWANMHGSVALGAAMVALYGAQALFRDRRNRLAAGLMLLAPACVLASPYALNLPGYYRTMLLDPPYGHDITEWQRTTPSGVTAAFFLLAVVAVVLFVVKRRRVSVLDWILLAVCLLTALSAIRLVPWFALTALALLPPLASGRVSRPFHGPMATAFALVALGGIVAAAGWASARSYASPDDRALPAVRAEAPEGRVFADLTLADWLLWNVPSLRGRIAFDGRPEILTRRQFKGVVRVERLSAGWRRELHGYRLLVMPQPRHHRLRLSGWSPVYADDNLVVLRRS